MKRAAIYARFSTELQRDRSIEDQVALCQTYAGREGLAVVEIFADRARSGASIFGRDGLDAMLKAAEAREFDCIVVEALEGNRWEYRLKGENFPYTFERTGPLNFDEGAQDLSIELAQVIGRGFDDWESSFTKLGKGIVRSLFGVDSPFIRWIAPWSRATRNRPSASPATIVAMPTGAARTRRVTPSLRVVRR